MTNESLVHIKIAPSSPDMRYSSPSKPCRATSRRSVRRLHSGVSDRKSTRLNSSHRTYLVCRLLLEKMGRVDSRKEGSAVSPSWPAVFQSDASAEIIFQNPRAPPEVSPFPQNDPLLT